MQKQTMLAALVISAMALNGAFAESSPVVSLTTATQNVQAANDSVKSVSDNVVNAVVGKTNAVDAQVNTVKAATSAVSSATNIVPINKVSIVDTAKDMAQDKISEQTDSIVADVAGDSGIVSAVAKDTVAEESEGLITKIFSIFQTNDEEEVAKKVISDAAQ